MRTAALVILFASLLSVTLLVGGEQKPPRGEPDKKEPPAAPTKVAELMQRKQKLSHEVLDALIMKDFKRISKDAPALVTISKAAEFQVHRTPRYMQYSLAFQEAAEKLAKNAREQNTDGTTLAFTEMTLSCVHCHDYIREKRGDE